MANNFSVVVLTPNGRRNTVKCNANTTILQILEQTCLKHGFKPVEYDLTHHNHILDVSTTFRFSGLPNNAFLEMSETKKARKESEVILGLQLENGERLMGNFSPSTDLLNILTSLVPDQCAPELNPVIIYMRREVYGPDSLRETTLKSLGLTGGRAVLRLIHRTPEQLKVQANVSGPLITKSKDVNEISFNTSSVLSSTKLNEPAGNNIIDRQVTKAENSGTSRSNLLSNDSSILNETFMSFPNSSTISSNEEKMDTADNSVLPEENISKMETDVPIVSNITSEDKQEDSHLNEEIIVLGERNALIFSQNMASRLPYDDMPDDFYDLSVNEVRKLFKDLSYKRQELENTPLQTVALKNLEENRRVITQLHDYRKVILRILFPDRTVLQGTFGPLDTIQTVINFVRDYLQNPTEDFDLYVSPPKQILKTDESLINANCVPSALIHFGPRLEESEYQGISGREYLKQELLSKLTSPEAASYSASKTRGITSVGESETSDAMTASSASESTTGKKPLRSQPFSVPGPSRAKDSKVPKWFKPAI